MRYLRVCARQPSGLSPPVVKTKTEELPSFLLGVAHNALISGNFISFSHIDQVTWRSTVLAYDGVSEHGQLIDC